MNATYLAYNSCFATRLKLLDSRLNEILSMKVKKKVHMELVRTCSELWFVEKF